MASTTTTGGVGDAVVGDVVGINVVGDAVGIEVGAKVGATVVGEAVGVNVDGVGGGAAPYPARGEPPKGPCSHTDKLMGLRCTV